MTRRSVHSAWGGSDQENVTRESNAVRWSPYLTEVLNVQRNSTGGRHDKPQACPFVQVCVRKPYYC